jgi:hypothetical protein
MLRSPLPLLVYPVPFAALDASGMPVGAVRFDPPTGRKNEVHFIGCTRQHTLIEKRPRAEGRQSVYTTSFRFDLTPQRITHTDYHVQRIRQGDLLAADPATAKRAGVPFVPPMTAFERARYAAIARWEQEYGEAPPVDKWPSLRLVTPDDDMPSTAPAHAVSIRARGQTAQVQPPDQEPVPPLAPAPPQAPALSLAPALTGALPAVHAPGADEHHVEGPGHAPEAPVAAATAADEAPPAVAPVTAAAARPAAAAPPAAAVEPAPPAPHDDHDDGGKPA